MKLNGWTRLWLVLSAVWLLAIGIRAYADLSSLLERKEWEVSKEGIGNATFVFSKSEPEDFVRRYINEELIPLVAKDPSAYVGKITTSRYDALVKKELLPRVTQYLKEAFLPVVSILLLGWAFVWVKRGFVRPSA
jgi:hypothetical protein